MKKIYGIFIALLCIASLSSKAQTTLDVGLTSGADIYDYDMEVRDFVLHATTSQKGVNRDYYWPYYGVNITHTSPYVPIGTIEADEVPTSIANAFIVQVVPGDTYITVRNKSYTNTYYVKLDLQFNWDYPQPSPYVVIPPGGVGTIPVTTSMNYRKTYYNSTVPIQYMYYTILFSTSPF
jgi:hypothetical protein